MLPFFFYSISQESGTSCSNIFERKKTSHDEVWSFILSYVSAHHVWPGPGLTSRNLKSATYSAFFWCNSSKFAFKGTSIHKLLLIASCLKFRLDLKKWLWFFQNILYDNQLLIIRKKYLNECMNSPHIDKLVDNTISCLDKVT